MQPDAPRTSAPPSVPVRFIVLALLGLFFVVLLPTVIVRLANALDARLGLPRIIFQPANVLIALAAVVGGLSLALWTISLQFRLGRGTPAPMMPTQKLVAIGPYAWCRNPMVLGTLVAYLGIGVWLGSLSAIAIVLAAASVLLTYVRQVEEKELLRRFGADYAAYRAATPFLIPRRPRV